ncbi:MAG: hypothetical protein AAFQ74_02215 [Cyanobacteria bacterium J06623_4]
MYHRLQKALAGVVLSGLAASMTLASGVAHAQQLNPELRQQFLADPLAAEQRDPLLPTLSVDRPYSPLELQMIDNALDQLNNTALLQLTAGDADMAFDLWLRELKLRRVLGTQAEFEAIQRVAGLAWAQQRPVEVQLLTLRTREIWDAMQQSLGSVSEEPFERQTEIDPGDSLISGATTIDIGVLTEIAQTFTTLRDIDSAVTVYQQLIALSSTRDEMLTTQQKALAELHLSWFQFSEAADIYLTLLAAAREAGDIEQEIDYLEQLAYSYQQAESLTNAVRAQTDLVELYQRQDNSEELPGLLVAIAQNYRALNLPTSAIDYYRAAYSAAQRFDQFSFSAQVLRDLGALYEALAMTAEALGAYSLLVPVEQQAYNDYGTMNAHDKIGQLQRRQGNDFEALKAFERGLVIANRLNLREAYFIEQIEALAAADVPSL